MADGYRLASGPSLQHDDAERFVPRGQNEDVAGVVGVGELFAASLEGFEAADAAGVRALGDALVESLDISGDGGWAGKDEVKLRLLWSQEVEGFDESQLVFLRVDAAVAGEDESSLGNVVSVAERGSVALAEELGVYSIADVVDAVVAEGLLRFVMFAAAYANDGVGFVEYLARAEKRSEDFAPLDLAAFGLRAFGLARPWARQRLRRAK